MDLKLFAICDDIITGMVIKADKSKIQVTGIEIVIINETITINKIFINFVFIQDAWALSSS